MNQLAISDVKAYVNENIETFHRNKIKTLQTINLQAVLKKKNPYLFKAKNITLAASLIEEILEAFLYSSEEKLFGDFLEDLAVFIAGKTFNGRKSSASGIDLEMEKARIRYLVSIKSGPNWGNSAQHKKQESDFQIAVKVLRQSKHTEQIQAVLGICYGKVKTSYLRGYMKIAGQNFWFFISDNPNLFTDIIEPLGHKAKEHNDQFSKQKTRLINSFTREFLNLYCASGNIDWVKLVQFNSGNLDLK